MAIPFYRQLRQWRTILVIAPTVAGILLGLRFMGALQLFELSALDSLLQMQPVPSPQSRIIIIGITEKDLREQQQWPLADRELAKLLTLIKKQQPRAIALDIYRDLPVEPGYDELVKVFRSTPNLIGIKKVVGSAMGAVVNPPPVLAELGQVTMNDLIIDADGKSRRSLLSVEKGDEVILSLGAESALQYLAAEGIELEVVDPDQQILKLGAATFQPLPGDAGGYVGADAGGYQILMLSELRNLGQRFPIVSLTDVLQNKIPPDLLRDRIVMIGVTAESAGDLFFVPRRNGWLNRSFVTASGVEIHADIANQILRATLDRQPLIQTWSEPWEALWIGVWCLLGAAIPWMGRQPRIQAFATSPKRQRLTGFPLVVLSLTLLGLGQAAASYFAIDQGVWIPVIPSLLGMTSAAFVVTGYLARSAAALRQTFGRYLADEIVTTLLDNPTNLKLGGEKRQVTLLISDLRGFSAISDRLSPEASVEAINIYLEAMTEVINRYHGTINDFIGDGIFAIFGAPIQAEDDAERAIACAIAMQKAMEAINEHNQSHSLPLLEMGIGIHTGEVLAGNIGSARRAKYTVMGREVNLAFRIESYTVGGQILVSENTIKACQTPLQFQRILEVQLKGFQGAIALHEVIGIRGSYNQFLPTQTEALVKLAQPLAVQLQILQNKHLLEHAISGTLTRLSVHSAELHTDYPLNLLDNLKLNLVTQEATYTDQEDFYAKVVEQPQYQLNHYQIRFTAITPAIAATLERFRQQNADKTA